jgi:hypothetical protein
MCDPISAIVAATVGAGGLSYVQGQKQAKAQKAAQEQSLAASQKQASLAEQQMNKANAKAPDVADLLSSNKSGGFSTLLTSPQGISTDKLKLGRTSLLGG